MTLEEQLFALMDQHGLTYISVAVYTLPDGTRFFGGGAHSESVGGQGNDTDGTAVSALNAALSDLEGKRLKITPVVELAAMGEAA